MVSFTYRIGFILPNWFKIALKSLKIWFHENAKVDHTGMEAVFNITCKTLNYKNKRLRSWDNPVYSPKEYLWKFSPGVFYPIETIFCFGKIVYYIRAVFCGIEVFTKCRRTYKRQSVFAFCPLGLKLCIILIWKFHIQISHIPCF
jgi:hypothetical protein